MSDSSILFLDIDDVLCINQKYGARELAAVIDFGRVPADFYEVLFSRAAVTTLNTIIAEFSPLVVISSTWAQHFSKDQFADTFGKCGVRGIRFHEDWKLPQPQARSDTRCLLIQRWLEANDSGKGYIVVDDEQSGTGLEALAGSVVLCELGVGLSKAHIPLVRQALGKNLETNLDRLLTSRKSLP